MSAQTAALSRHVEAACPGTPWSGDIARLGMILLAVDRATESELHRMLPADLATIHVNRVAMADSCTVEHLRALESDLARAAANLLPGTPLAAIGFACTSGAAAIGVEGVRACVAASHPGTPVTTPLEAAGHALGALGAHRIAVLTPYIDEVNRIIRDGLVADGFGIAGFDSFHLRTDAEMTGLAPASLRDAVLALDDAGVEALFVCCTALRPSGIIAEVEARTGKPVITSHQALLWHGLALAGMDTPIEGFGRLLAMPGRSGYV